VYIFNAKQYQLPVDEGTDVSGMLVYNTNSGLPDGVGLYTWNGLEWKSMVSSNRCIPVTVTSKFSKTGSTFTFKVTVTEGTPNFSYTWYKEGVTNPVQTTANVSAASDNYTTTGAGTYSCKIANPCTVTPVSFTFTVDASGEALIDNGNGTFTDGDGNLVCNGKIYRPVKSDIPGVYLDEAGEIVYAGADGIPGNEDDDVYVVPDYPIGKQKILFSVSYPIVIHAGETHQIELDFADGRNYTGKIKYLSSNPGEISVSETGVITTGSAVDASTLILVILEDGSIVTRGYANRQRSDATKLTGVEDKNLFMEEGIVQRIGTSARTENGSHNIYNLKTMIYTIANADGTGSTITPDGWFQAGTSGVVTVTATATDEDGNFFTGTITITISQPTPENKPYETASTNWAALEPALAYAGGDGTEASPYQISSLRQLKKLSVDITMLGSTDVTYQKYFELTTDLDFSADNTVKESLIGSFQGTLDGKGHVIKDLNIDATGLSYIALIRTLEYGEIKNLGREGGSTIGNDATYIGGLLVYISNNAKLSNCYNSSSINAVNAGGLMYAMYGGSITNCYNSGNITSSTGSTGGLIMLIYNNTQTIINCYNSGNVAGTSSAGGLITRNGDSTASLNMTNCFNFGDCTLGNNNDRVGAFIGYVAGASVSASNVYSRPNVASANNGAIPKPNHPIGWINAAGKTIVDAILAANPTLKEDAKYSLDYSKSTSFVTELGSAFKYANGRTPKLAWEK
jgi:hypothetical protein